VRYVVVGAGAVGGTVGGLLYDAGRDVILVARGAHGEAMQRDGLRLALPDRVVSVRCPVATSVREVTFDEDDVVLLTTKAQDSAVVLDELTARRGDLPVLCVQNGVANERMALQRFTDVYGVVVMLPAVLLEPGRIDAQGHPFSGLLDIGRVPTGSDEVAEHIAADLSASGFVSRAVDDVMRWKYAKLLRNVGNAVEVVEAVEYLKGEGTRDPRLHEVTMALAGEMLALGGLASNAATGRAKAEAALADGRAAEVFARMVAALGGPDDFLQHTPRYLAHAPVIRPCSAERSGYVTGMDARQVGIAVVALGGGRTHADDAIDPSVGLTDVIDVGTQVRAGSLLGVVHAANDADADQAIAILQRAIRIEDGAPAERPTIIDRIGR